LTRAGPGWAPRNRSRGGTRHGGRHPTRGDTGRHATRRRVLAARPPGWYRFRVYQLRERGIMKDHLTDIFAYRNDLERDLADVIEAYGHGGDDEPVMVDGDEYETPAAWLEGFALECLVWDRRPTEPGENHGDRGHRVEWLLAMNGPTVRLTYDDRWNHGTLMHSWGADPHTGEPRDTIEIRGVLCEWLAEWFGVTV